MFPTRAQIEAGALARLRRRGKLILTEKDLKAAGLNLLLAMNYERLVDLEFSSPKKLRMRSREPKVCRYRQKSSAETTFKQESHAIPECLGNRRLISLDECDLCNQRFSETFEHHFDAFSRPLRTLQGIRGKNRVPRFKSPDGKGRVTYDPTKRNYRIIESEKGTIVDQADGEMSFAMKLTAEPHVPLEAYRSLIKMAFAVLPQGELPRFEQTRRWLTGPLFPLPQPARCCLTLLSVPLASSRITLWRRAIQMPRLPYLLAALGFSQCGFMYAIPLCSEDRHLVAKEVVLPVFDLTQIPTLRDAEWRPINLSSTAKETKLTYEIQSSFQSVEEIPADEFWETE